MVDVEESRVYIYIRIYMYMCVCLVCMRMSCMHACMCMREREEGKKRAKQCEGKAAGVRGTGEGLREARRDDAM